MQAVRGDPPRLDAQLIDRRQRPTRQHVPACTGQQDDERHAEDQHDGNFPQLLLDPLFGAGLGRVRPLILELLAEFVAHREERGGGIHDQHQREHRGVPHGQPNTDRCARPPAHGSPSCNTNPTPRTV